MIKLNRYLIISLICLASIIPIVISLADTDGDSEGSFSLAGTSTTATGNFTRDDDNDAPTFIEVFDSSGLIPPADATTFHAIVQDTDNHTTELVVKLFWSANSFSITYNTTLSYSSTYAIDQYRYIYSFAGQTSGTYYEYYYSVYDGNNTVYENNTGLFYDIQWEAVAGPTTGGGSPDIPEEEDFVGTIFQEVLRPQNIIMVAGITVAIVLFLLFFLLIDHQRKKQRGLVFGFDRRRKFTFRRVAIGSVVVLFVSVLLINSYSPMATFSFNNNRLDYDIREYGIVDSESIYEVSQTVDRTIYRHYKLTEDSAIRKIKMSSTDSIFPHELTYSMLISYDEDPLTNEALWLNTPITSNTIAFSKVIIFSGTGKLVREYNNPPATQDQLGIFLYENELGNLRGAFNVKYVGAYYNGDVLEKVIFSVYFKLVFEEVM